MKKSVSIFEGSYGLQSPLFLSATFLCGMQARFSSFAHLVVLYPQRKSPFFLENYFSAEIWIFCEKLVGCQPSCTSEKNEKRQTLAMNARRCFQQTPEVLLRG